MSITRPNGRSAFTLVELLVVIGIIALLVSILLPTLNRARASAYAVQCASTLRQFCVANQMYINDQKGFCIPGYCEYDPNANPTVGGGSRASNWWTGNTAFRKYVGFTPFTPAPTATTDFPVVLDFTPKPSANPTSAFNGYLPAGFVCPAATRLLANVISDARGKQYYPPITQYGMNIEGISSAANNTVTPWAQTRASGGAGVFGYKASFVRRPSEKLFLVDAMTAASLVDESGSGPFPGTNNKNSNYDVVSERTGTGTIPGAGPYDASRMTVWRHRGAANVAFFDGHVTLMKKDEIYTIDPTTTKPAPNDRLWKVLE